MKTKKLAVFSGRVGFFVLALLTLAVVGGQVNPPPQSSIAASANLRLQAAADRLQELETLARSLEDRRPVGAEVEATSGSSEADGKR